MEIRKSLVVNTAGLETELPGSDALLLGSADYSGGSFNWNTLSGQSRLIQVHLPLATNGPAGLTTGILSGVFLAENASGTNGQFTGVHRPTGRVFSRVKATTWQAWIEGAKGSRTRIAILGHSLGTHNALSTCSWPDRLSQYLNNSGGDVANILNFSINGLQSSTALSDTALFGGGKTPVQALIAARPDIVIIDLGVNDVLTQQIITPSTAITTAAAKANIASVVSTIKAALPSSAVYLVRLKAHDETHATPSTLLNRHVAFPAFWTLRTTGQLANCWTDDIEGDALEAGRRTAYANYEDYCDYAVTLPGLAGVLNVDVFRAARLGGMSPDRMHLNDLGMSFIAASIAQQLPVGSYATFGKSRMPWNSPKSFFDDILESSSGKWIRKAASVFQPYNFIGQESSKASLLDIDNWMRAYRGTVIFNRTTVPLSGEVSVLIRGAKPHTTVQAAIGIGPWLPNITLNANGDGCVTVPIRALGLGTTTVRYKIGEDIFGPLSITVTEDGGSPDLDTGWQNMTLISPWAAANSDNIPQYRRIGKVMYLRGALTAPFANNNSKFWEIPAGLRPVSSLYLAVAGGPFLVGHAKVHCSAPAIQNLIAYDQSSTSGNVTVALTGLSWPIG